MEKTIGCTAVENLAYVEGLYGRYLRDGASVAEAWRLQFEDWRNEAHGKTQRGPSFHVRSLFHPGPVEPTGGRASPTDPLEAGVRDRLNQLIRSYRVRGHMLAELDPLGSPRGRPPELELSYYGFRDCDLDLLTGCSALPYNEPLTIRDIVQRLQNTYCRSIGVQFMHIDDLAVREWLQDRRLASEPQGHSPHKPVARAE